MKHFGSSISVTSNDIHTIISELEEFQRRCHIYDSYAKEYNDMGKPELLKNLSIILNDINCEIQKYKGKYQDKLKEENEIKEIIQDVHKYRANREIERQNIIKEKDKYISNIYNEVARRGMEVQDKINERWHADFAQYCIHCKQYLSREYNFLEICPNCGRYLHK
jgi:hypothetical protein